MPEPQHMIALHKANKIRLDRAEVKRAIKANDRVLMRVLRDPPECVMSSRITELMCSQVRWGTTRTRKFLTPLGIRENRTVGELTIRQREAIASELEGARL